MRITFARKVATAVITLALISGSSSAIAAANKANGACAKAGATTTISGKKYVCAQNIMKKLTWMVPAATSAGASNGASKSKPGVKPTIKGGKGGDDEGREHGEGREREGDDD
jgi:hypothetical protein